MTGSAHTRPKTDLRYSERLYVPWWGWPLPLVAAALLAAQIHMGYPGLPLWLPYAVLLPLVIVLLLALSKTPVRVTGGTDPEFWVGDAHLPVRFVGAVEVIGKQDKRVTLGPDLDPAAFLVHRGWVPGMVRIHLTDSEDPTPYWLVSTRHPRRLADLLGARLDEPIDAGVDREDRGEQSGHSRPHGTGGQGDDHGNR